MEKIKNPISFEIPYYIINKFKNMSNMSYCRFENTCQNLQDCYDALSESGGIKEVEETANQYEKKHIRKLVELCKDIVDEFGDELDNDNDG